MTFEQLVDAYHLYCLSMWQDGETAMPLQDFAWCEAVASDDNGLYWVQS